MAILSGQEIKNLLEALSLEKETFQSCFESFHKHFPKPGDHFKGACGIWMLLEQNVGPRYPLDPQHHAATDRAVHPVGDLPPERRPGRALQEAPLRHRDELAGVPRAGRLLPQEGRAEARPALPPGRDEVGGRRE